MQRFFKQKIMFDKSQQEKKHAVRKSSHFHQSIKQGFLLLLLLLNSRTVVKICACVCLKLCCAAASLGPTWRVVFCKREDTGVHRLKWNSLAGCIILLSHHGTSQWTDKLPHFRQWEAHKQKF